MHSNMDICLNTFFFIRETETETQRETDRETETEKEREKEKKNTKTNMVKPHKRFQSQGRQKKKRPTVVAKQLSLMHTIVCLHRPVLQGTGGRPGLQGIPGCHPQQEQLPALGQLRPALPATAGLP